MFAERKESVIKEYLTCLIVFQRMCGLFTLFMAVPVFPVKKMPDV